MPKAAYVDNGSNYSSKEFSLICARLGIVLIHTPVRDGAAKGRINGSSAPSGTSSSSATSATFAAWTNSTLSSHAGSRTTYHAREHSTLGMKPIDRFGLDLSRVRHLADNPFNAANSFFWKAPAASVDNTFSYDAIRYEAPRDLRNTTITIRHNH